MRKIIGITGLKDVGKTHYASLIIKLLVKRGYQVGSIKHAHHNFDIDKSGTDSFKHREAGSNQVIISSSKRWAKIPKPAPSSPEASEKVTTKSPSSRPVTAEYFC